MTARVVPGSAAMFDCRYQR